MAGQRAEEARYMMIHVSQARWGDSLKEGLLSEQATFDTSQFPHARGALAARADAAANRGLLAAK